MPVFQSLKPLTRKPDSPRTHFGADIIDKVSLCQLAMAKRLIASGHARLGIKIKVNRAVEKRFRSPLNERAQNERRVLISRTISVHAETLEAF